jgi:hypothetical protein
MIALDAIFIAFAASVGSTFSALEIALFEFDLFITEPFVLGRLLEPFVLGRLLELFITEPFELEGLLDTDTEAGKSDPEVTLTAFVITAVLRGSLASVIVP